MSDEDEQREVDELRAFDARQLHECIGARDYLRSENASLRAALNRAEQRELSALHDLDEATALLREAHGQYGMPIGIDERIGAFIDSVSASRTTEPRP